MHPASDDRKRHVRDPDELSPLDTQVPGELPTGDGGEARKGDETPADNAIFIELGADDLHALKRILASIANVDSSEPGDQHEALELAQLMFEMRRVRAQHFAPSMFNEPAWDMLMALYIAREPPGLKELSRETNIPLSTAVRWLDYLEKHNLIARERCEADRRSYSIRLTDHARMNMLAWLSGVAGRLPRAID